MADLFNSGIMNSTFDFGYPWPEVDVNKEKMLMPFNKIIYEDLRYDYSNIFPSVFKEE